MTKKINVSAKAADEIRQAAIWYDDQSWGLSKKFIAELEYYYERIKKYPDSYKGVTKNVSRCLLETFPYIIFFSISKDEITILRVRHTKQRPLKRYR
ncbi:MAG TPA: type II toxin-antitoxin system RelE/ParE family toxin [Chitinophagaceae bacterium]|jgi:plasmid stabilization system protein ParE